MAMISSAADDGKAIYNQVKRPRALEVPPLQEGSSSCQGLVDQPATPGPADKFQALHDHLQLSGL